MRKRLMGQMVMGLAVLAGATAWGAEPRGWVHATVSVALPPPPAGQAAMAAPKPMEYYFNEEQRMAGVLTEVEGDRGVQFMAPNQGYMDTFSSKRNEILHSELTKNAVLPQDRSLPTSLDDAMEDAKHLLNVERANDAVTSENGAEVHTLTGAAASPRVILYADPATKQLGRVVQDLGQGGVTTITYDYTPRDFKNIFDMGVPRSAKLVDNVPNPATRGLLDQLDARVEKDFGDAVAVLVTDPQQGGRHDARLPYTVEVFGRNGNAFVYRVHSVATPPARDIERALAALRNEPATTYVIYDGRTLFQLTYDPQTGKPLPTEREVKLEAKDFAPSSFSRRLFLGRDALGTTVPVSVTEAVEDPRARPGQRGIKVSRPTTLFYQESETKTAQVQAQQLTVYWFDPAKGNAPVEYYERRDPAQGTQLRPEVMQTKFSDFVAAPDGSALPTHWQTGTWDVRGSSQVTDFTLIPAFNKRLEGAWFAKPAIATPPANTGAPGPR